MRRAISAAAFLLATIPLTPRVSADPDAERLAHAVAEAHGLAAWQAHDAVSVDLTVVFNGHTRVDGAMLYQPRTGRVRIEQRDGTLLVFDGHDARVSPASAEFEDARFHLLTWPYFLAAPFKIIDPGTQTAMDAPQMAHGVEHQTLRLTFDAGIGDSPEDWYVCYACPSGNHLCAMGYIVTYFSGGAEGAGEPHAITYEAPQTFGGVLLSTRWRFWNWTPTEGIHGEPIGQADIHAVRFAEATDADFTPPPGSRIDPLPAR